MIIGVAKIFRFTCTFFGASLHIVEHLPEVSAKNDDRYPDLNAVLCLPLNDCFELYFSKSKKLLRYVFLKPPQNKLLNGDIINIDITINILS